MAKPPQQQIPVEFVDRPEVAETFADWTSLVTFDGQTLRIELCATRLDHTQPASTPRARRVPVSRLVLPPSAAIDLFNRLRQTMSGLVQQGIAKQSVPTTAALQGSVKPVKTTQ